MSIIDGELNLVDFSAGRVELFSPIKVNVLPADKMYLIHNFDGSGFVYATNAGPFGVILSAGGERIPLHPGTQASMKLGRTDLTVSLFDGTPQNSESIIAIMVINKEITAG